MIDRKRTACFTGHREIPESKAETLEKLLDKVIEQLYNKGVIFFGAGGCYGFDALAEKAILRARERHNEIKLILVLPCKDQDKYWNDRIKVEYAEIVSKADKVVYTSEFYSKGCMHKRNRHLVDYSGYCVAYMTRNNGGTAYTIDYARKNGLMIFNLGRYFE